MHVDLCFASSPHLTGKRDFYLESTSAHRTYDSRERSEAICNVWEAASSWLINVKNLLLFFSHGPYIYLKYCELSNVRLSYVFTLCQSWLVHQSNEEITVCV